MKHVVKVDKTNNGFRIVIPRKIILEKRWGDVTHVLVEDHYGDKLLVRRFLDGKALEAEDN